MNLSREEKVIFTKARIKIVHLYYLYFYPFDTFERTMACYCLFVLKAPLNTNQPTNQPTNQSFYLYIFVREQQVKTDITNLQNASQSARYFNTSIHSCLERQLLFNHFKNVMHNNRKLFSFNFGNSFR